MGHPDLGGNALHENQVCACFCCALRLGMQGSSLGVVRAYEEFDPVPLASFLRALPRAA
ncbi:MAG: hypothetical protein RLZZ216_2251 [Cyanobacteriota bacterium]